MVRTPKNAPNIECSHCGHRMTLVRDSRAAIRFDVHVVRRRRECLKCGGRWTTYEIPGAVIDTLETKVRKSLIMELIEKF